MRAAAWFLAFVLLVGPGCVVDEEPGPTGPSPSASAGNRTAPAGPFAIASPAFQNGQRIPTEYSCDGQPANVSPALAMSNIPLNATAWALIMEDPDVSGGTRTITHWTFWNLNHDVATVPRAADIAKLGGRVGKAYGGPCPPPLDPAHRYFFRAYALDRPLELAAGGTVEQLRDAMKGHVAAEAMYMGTYSRPSIPPFGVG